MNSILNSAFHVLKSLEKLIMTPKPISETKISNKFPWTRLTEQENFQFYSFKSLQLSLSGSLGTKWKKIHSSLLETVPLSSGARPEENRMYEALESQLWISLTVVN